MAYLPLSTANLPDPVIDPAQESSPEDYFDVALYTGNGTSTEVSTLSFQPDFVWGKKRSSAGSHFLLDAIRGVNSTLSSNTNGAEDTSTDIFTSFDSDGFTVGANGQSNSNGVTYASWNWKANGSGVSNTDGSVTSTVSANTTSGFSIATWTDDGVNNNTNETIGHGLTQTPEMIIMKPYGPPVASWYVHHKDLANPAQSFLLLNSTGAVGANASAWGNTAPTATTFGFRNNYHWPSTKFIAYCFHGVEGFSSFGSYTGNGSTDGPFVYTGFRPAFVMVKATSGSESWNIVDYKRDNFNDGNTNLLFANLSNSEGTSSPHYIDLLSNGMKLSGNIGNWNTSGVTYIYMAFAENPFKYSNAR